MLQSSSAKSGQAHSQPQFIYLFFGGWGREFFYGERHRVEGSWLHAYACW